MMEIPLLAPVEGCVIKCLAVDRITTKVRDDGFRITRKGKWTQIDMVAIVPPEEKLMRENLRKVLEKMSDNGTRQGTTTGLFRPEVMYPSSLSETPKSVLVVTHLIHLNELVREETTLGKAVLETSMSDQEYGESERFFHDEIAIMRSLKTNRRLHKHVESCRNHDFITDHGKCGIMMYAMLELFNETCRLYANSWDSPFVSFLRSHTANSGFRIGGYARFNCGLRDPCAFINATNLARRLNGQAPFLSEPELVKILPRII